LHLCKIIPRGAKSDMMQTFLGTRIEQDGVPWQLGRTEVDSLIPGGSAGQAKVLVEPLPDAQIGDFKGIMEQGADGYRCHVPEAACIVFQNGACFSLHGL
jgi:hypothetical protein